MLFFGKNKTTEKLNQLSHNLLLAEAEASYKNVLIDENLSKKYFEDLDISQKLTNKFFDILKLGLTTQHTESWSIQNEIKYINLYIDLWKELSGDQLTCQCKIQLEDENVLIQPLILLPLIQNSFYIGYHKMAEFPIKIHLQVYTNRLSLTVSNRVNHHINNQDSTEVIRLFKSRLLLQYPTHQLITNSNTTIFKANLLLNLQQEKK